MSRRDLILDAYRYHRSYRGALRIARRNYPTHYQIAGYWQGMRDAKLLMAHALEIAQ